MAKSTTPQCGSGRKCVCWIVLLVFTVTAIFEWWQNGSPMTKNQNTLQRVITYLLLITFGASTVAFDWYTSGPTVAIKHGAVAAIAAWILVVPFGFISEVLVELVWFWLFIVAGVGSLCVAVSSVEAPCSILLGLAGLCTCVFIAMRFTVDVSHTFGTAVLYIIVYGLVRLVMNETAATMEPVASWAGDWGYCEKVDEHSSEYKDRLAEFSNGCQKYASKYPFGLKVEAVYRVIKDEDSSKRLKRTADGQRLFHGTSRVAALGIVSDGFRLPDHNGMFGKGIYFANCPLKSWQYTDGRAWRCGVMLMCWVELGRASQAKQAMSSLQRPPRRTFTEWLRGKPKYESVIGLDQEAGGSLRVPEYIVYDPAKVEVEYVLEVKSKT